MRLGMTSKELSRDTAYPGLYQNGEDIYSSTTEKEHLGRQASGRMERISD